MNEIDQRGTVEDDRVPDVKRKRSFLLALHQLRANRLAHVVDDQHDLGQPFHLGHGLVQVGLLEQRVVILECPGLRLFALAETDHVGHHHARPLGHLRHDPRPIPRRPGKAMHDQNPMALLLRLPRCDHKYFVSIGLKEPALFDPVLEVNKFGALCLCSDASEQQCRERQGDNDDA